MHSTDDYSRIELGGLIPESILSGRLWVHFLLDKLSFVVCRPSPYFALIFCFQVVCLEVEWQVVLLRIRDVADIELVLIISKEAIHADIERHFRLRRAIDAYKVAVTVGGFYHSM